MKVISRIKRRALSRCVLESMESRVMLSGGPSAPATVVATNGTTPTDLVVSWAAATGATSYQIWRGTTASSGSATEINPNYTAGTTYDDTQLTTGTTYFYWIVASNSSGNSGFSTIASGTAGTEVFTDTFGSDGISSAWGPDNATDPNNGKVIYTDQQPAGSSASNPVTEAIVSDSQATDGQALAMSLTPSPTQSGYYDSAEICTEVDPSGLGNSLEYGEITARIKIPGGNNSNAIWPAFWMLGDDISGSGAVGWPNCGEIDIMENKGSQPSTISSTLHGPATGGGDYYGGSGVGASYSLSGQNYYSSYHVFTVDWGPNSISFSVDGHTFETQTPATVAGAGSWVFNGHPFFIILDVCEGGKFAPGTITSTQTMDVDYVRAYSLAAPTGLAATVASSSQQAVVSWAAVTGATTYEVWRNSTNDPTSATELNGSVSGTSYTDTSATSGTKYYYWTVSQNAFQSSGFSADTYSGKLGSSVTIASPPSTIYYDGKSDVTSWAVATVNGAGGQPAPTGNATLTWYAGTTATGTPLGSPPTTVGAYTVVANYAGDTNYQASQSSPVTFTISNTAGVSPGSGQYDITWASNIPTLDVTQGNVTLTSDVSASLPSYVLAIENGAGVSLNSVQHVSAIHLAGNATLDVAAASVFISYGAGPDPISTIAAWITSGYAGGLWNGTGIISSTARTYTNYGLGYADSADPGNPPALGTDSIEILYTLQGDANLDGKVNGTDFILMSNHFNQAVTNGWDAGDFNYDGAVNGTDFLLMSSNFNQSAQAPAVQPVAGAAAVVQNGATSDTSIASSTSSTDDSAATDILTTTSLSKQHNHKVNRKH